MTTAVIESTDRTAPVSAKKIPLRISREELLWPLVFMLSMTMIGLKFPVGYLLAPVVLVNRFRHNRYDFIIMVTIMMDGYNLFGVDDILIKPYNVASVLSLCCLLVIRKAPVLKRITAALAVYLAVLLAICSLSDESVISQIYGVRNYLLIAYLFFPIVAFSGTRFEMDVFLKRIMIFAFIFCWYYIIDSIVMGGFFMMPEDSTGWSDGSTFYSLNIHPILNVFIRRWPLGLYIFGIAAYAMSRRFTLSRAQWLLVAAAFIISRSFTVTVAFIVAYFISQNNWRRLLQYFCAGIVGLAVMYFVDGIVSGGATVVEETETGVVYHSSVMRVQSQVDQVIDLVTGNYDEETLAALGSTRGAQVVPKFELLYDLGKQWTGLGFLDRERTTNQKFVIENEMYTDVEKSVEVATGVEVVPAQIVLSVGYIGLVLHILFFVYLWYVVRRMPDSGLFLCCTVFFAVAGIGGFAGLIEPPSLVLVGLATGAVILGAKDRLPGFVATD